MSSSPKHGRSAQLRHAASLLQVLEQVPDPRDRRGRQHSLVGVIAVALTAVLAGARSYLAVAEWANDLTGDQLARLGLTRPEVPEESTFRRILSGVDAALLDAVIGVFLWTRIATIGGRRIIALDGKTVRGARNADSTAPHLVGAPDHHTGVVVGQMATATKSNEIPTVQALLRLFNLAGTVVTVDAMPSKPQRSAAPAPSKARLPGKRSTSSPIIPPPPTPNSPPGSGVTGPSRTNSTGNATSCGKKTNLKSVPVPDRAPWPPSATQHSRSSA
jgi:predicted transposase YbfD/YdcC